MQKIIKKTLNHLVLFESYKCPNLRQDEFFLVLIVLRVGLKTQDKINKKSLFKIKYVSTGYV